MPFPKVRFCAMCLTETYPNPGKLQVRSSSPCTGNYKISRVKHVFHHSSFNGFSSFQAISQWGQCVGGGTFATPLAGRPVSPHYDADG